MRRDRIPMGRIGRLWRRAGRWGYLALTAACAGAGGGSGAAPSVAPVGPAAQLITTDRLAGLLASSEPVLLDVRAAWTDYLQNHLPGAQWLSVETLRASEHGLPFQLLAPEAYFRLFSRLGVRGDRPVVVYSAGESLDIDATFAVWLLAAAGQDHLYLLDGGYAKWLLENRPLARHYPRTAHADFPARAFEPQVVALEELRRAMTRKDVLLVDARNAQQFEGSAGAQLRRGHIPGAVNHPWQSDLEQRDLALVWKSADDLRTGYMAQGISPDRDVVVYCNTSTEASHVFFALRYLLGYPRVRIYTGAWSEWAEREELPIETGP
ncbi:MAG: sulfurtransferase [Gemmatimonadales bacterium]